MAKKRHKYYKREEIKNKYRYFYSKDEYDSWLHGRNKERTMEGNRRPITSNIRPMRPTNPNDGAMRRRPEGLEVQVRPKRLVERKPDIENRVSSFFDWVGIDRKVGSMGSGNSTPAKLISKARNFLKKTKAAAEDAVDYVKDRVPNNGRNLKNKITDATVEVKEAIETKIKEDGNVTLPENRDVPVPRTAESDPADNWFTKEEAVENLEKSGYGDYLMTICQEAGIDVKNLEEAYDIYAAELGEENVPNWLQRTGMWDETAPGGHPESFDDLSRTDGDIDDDLDMEMVNYPNLMQLGIPDNDGDGYPDVPASEAYGHENNCAYCTLAYEYRQRGYDVEASAVSYTTANTYDEIESWYEGGKFTHSNTTNAKKLEKQILADCPDGSRGQFCVMWSGGGGHSIAYEVRGGEVYLRDCQINKEYKLTEYPNMWAVDSASYMRTDNLELSERSLRGVKNRKK